MRIDDAVNEFELSLVGNIKAASRRLYVRQVRKLLDYFSPETKLESITAADLRRWRLSLLESDQYNTNTANQITGSAKRFFRFCVSDGLLPADPASSLRPVQNEEESKPRAIDIDDVLRLLNSAVADDNCRDVAIILTLFGTGCRVSGLCGLSLKDIDLPEGRAWVVEKGRGTGKGRWVFLDPPVKRALTDYIQNERPSGCGDHLFLSSRKKPLSRFGVWAMLKRRAEKSGVSGRFNPHAFRHTFAIEHLQNGQPLAALSQLMGHVDISTTHRYYARYEEKQLHDLHTEHSPVNSLVLPGDK